MSDKKYDDQEYRYPDDEQPGDMMTQGDTQQSQDDNSCSDKKKTQENSGSAKESIASLLKRIRQLPFLKNKRIVILVIAVVVLFALIKMLGHHGSPSLPKKATQSAQVQAPLQDTYRVMGSQVNDLSTKSIQNKRDVNVLTNNVRQMEKSMESMNDVVVQLTDEVTGLTKQVNALKTQQDIQKRAMIKKTQMKPKDYYITAMVPGRAWVKSTDSNQGISIRVGDKLPTYGKISSIDSDNGVIITTSGRIIKFGANDS